MDAPDGEAFDVSGRLDRAAAALDRERRRTAAERAALSTFEDRVREVDTETTVATGGGVAAVGVATAGTDGLAAVREAYEATVMAVPHYEAEYDDSYVESLEAEFSTDLAAALTDGTRFNERCKRALLSAVGSARAARETLAQALDDEADSLAAARETLPPVAAEVANLADRSLSEAPFGTLDAYRARLLVLEQECEVVADDRQTTLFEQRRRTALPTDAPDVPQYVYQVEPFDYPVMSAVAECRSALDAVREDVEAAMARC